MNIKELADWQGELVVERLEDGKAHIELVEGNEVKKTTTIPKKKLSDNHFHDGMVTEVKNGELHPLNRESAERERYVKEKIERMGKRMEDI